MNDPLEPLTTAIRNSPFVHAIRVVRADGGLPLALGSSSVRPLTPDEITRLQANGNSADDWTRVWVTDGFRPEAVRYSEFRGDVVLGQFGGVARDSGNADLPSGVYHSTVVDSVIGHDATVRNVSLLARYVIGMRATLVACGRIACEGMTSFGNGTAIRIGPQSGGRILRPFSEITLQLVDSLTTPSNRRVNVQRYAEGLSEYLGEIESDRGVIAGGAVVSNVAVIQNSYVGPAAQIDGASRVENCTILSNPDEPVQVRDGACVTNSVLQRGSCVLGPAVIDRSVLMEHAEVHQFGKVAESVLGSNTSVGGAEVTSCLVGPFVGCHHQSLLISVRWLGGRGNIGAGADIGCNHTSRAPDQEAILGEGLFVGLGVRLQYPINLIRSPYTVLACGLSMPPQRVDFPFSLIRPALESIPGIACGTNVLVPAWVLAENLYAIERTMLKFHTRDRTPHQRLSHEVFRPEIIDLLTDACRRLEAVRCCKEVYTHRDIPGLGRNILFERDRVAAIQCYREHLERCELLKLLGQLTYVTTDAAENRVSLCASDDEIRDRLMRLSELLNGYGRAVEKSKTRDDIRGPVIIPDYTDAHPRASDDPVVQGVWESVRRTQTRIVRIVEGLTNGTHVGGTATAYSEGVPSISRQ